MATVTENPYEHCDVRVHRARAYSGNPPAGGCLACNEFQTSEGGADHAVAVIRLGGSEVRLCRKCSMALRLALGRAWR